MSSSDEHNVYWDMWPGRSVLIMFGFLPPLKECKGIIMPEVYLKANGDLLAMLFAVTWLVTIFFNPHQIERNPLKDRLAYNNFCVGLDTPPARYPGQVMFFMAYYATVRFSTLSLKRSFERRRMGETPVLFRFSVFTDICLMAAITAFALCFVITPFISVYGHTLPFIIFIYARLLVVMSRMLESNKTTTKGYIFLGYYAVVSMILPVYYLASYAYFDIENKDVTDPSKFKTLVPWWVGVIVDYSWFCCLPMTGVFMHTDDVDHVAMQRIASAYDRDMLVNADGDLDLDHSGDRRDAVRGAEAFCLVNTWTLWAIGAVVYLGTSGAVVSGIIS